MADQETETYDDSSSTDDLQLQLRSAEYDKKLIALKFLDTGEVKVTEATYELTDEDMTRRKLRLALDPAGTLPAGNDEELVCRGEASIDLQATKVAAFRPKAA